MKRLIPAALLLASCGQSGSPDIQIKDAWARETVAGQTSTAAYFTIDNDGSADDRLTGVTTVAPASASLHASEYSIGVSRMRDMSSGLAVPAGATIELKPGATHVMIVGLGTPLKAGETVKLNLRFEKSGDKPIDVAVSPATGPEGHCPCGDFAFSFGSSSRSPAGPSHICSFVRRRSSRRKDRLWQSPGSAGRSR